MGRPAGISYDTIDPDKVSARCQQLIDTIANELPTEQSNRMATILARAKVLADHDFTISKKTHNIFQSALNLKFKTAQLIPDEKPNVIEAELPLPQEYEPIKEDRVLTHWEIKAEAKKTKAALKLRLNRMAQQRRLYIHHP